MKRIFLAADIEADEKFIRYFKEIHDSLPGKSIKWVNPLQMHITLRFFGDTDDDDILKISKAVLRATQNFPAFDSGFVSLGVFKSLSRPHVIWAGCENPDNLKNLKFVIDKELSGEGFLPDRSDYSPHLTLGRIRDFHQRIRLGDIIEKYRDTQFLMQHFGSVILYESRLRPSGPEYIAIQEFRLK